MIPERYLQEIVKEFGSLTEKPYSDQFCWEADVGNMITPLQFAAECNNVGSDNPRAFVHNIERWADETATICRELIDETNAQRDEDDRIERDCSLVVDDILRNIANDAMEALETLAETE